MPLLYGEGRRAVIKLQEEVLKVTEDYSLILWSIVLPDMRLLVNASVPDRVPYKGYNGYSSTLTDGVGKFKLPDSSGWKYEDLMDISVSTRSPAEASDIQMIDGPPPLLTSRGLRVCLHLRHYTEDIYTLPTPALSCVVLAARRSV
jgi:hypothetical protein